MADIEVSVECQVCGKALDADVRHGNEIYVPPCETCLLESYNDGYDTAKREVDNG
jgi:hypothetical protein